MQKPSLEIAIEKLAIAGEQAGFSVEQMIRLLNLGMSVEELVDVIATRLEAIRRPFPIAHAAVHSNWVVCRCYCV